MVVERSARTCVLCGAGFEGRTFLCRACSDRYRGQVVPLAVRKQFYEALDRAYPVRSNTYGAWNHPAALLRELAGEPRDARVLELGAGGGFMGAELFRRGFTCLTLSDLTATALAALHDRVPHASLVGANAAWLPFVAGAFDIVLSSDLIEHLPAAEADAHIAEVARVLAPGGRYYIKTPNRPAAAAYYRLRGLHDAHFWHPSMCSVRELRDNLARHGLHARLLPQPRLTGAQLTKLPASPTLRAVAGRVPLGWLPAGARPHLEVVAIKRE